VIVFTSEPAAHGPFTSSAGHWHELLSHSCAPAVGFLTKRERKKKKRKNGVKCGRNNIRHNSHSLEM